MKYTLSIELPGLSRMTNKSGRKSTHWRVLKAEADRWKRMVGLVATPKPPTPLKHAKLTLTRCSSSSPDSDGLVSGFKHIIDGLVLCGVLENDRFENIGMPTYIWRRVPMKKGKMLITVEAIIL